MASDPDLPVADQRAHHALIPIASLFFSLTGVFGIASLSNPDIPGDVAGQAFPQEQPHIALYPTHTTTTSTGFTTTQIIEEEPIPHTTQHLPNPAMDADTTQITQKGSNGHISRTFAIDWYYDEEVSRTLLSEERTEPVEEIIEYGTKPRSMETPTGSFAYSRTMKVYATSYDGSCKGCSGITATGTRVYHGICAVDPRVIPLGTKFFVPGYGVCTAADTGGAIKGNKIDVGFENIKTGWWSSRWVEIYIQ